MATIFDFYEIYTSACEHCGVDLEDWEWLEDEMIFKTSCTCGTEYILKPVNAVLAVDTGDLDPDEEIE